MVSGGGLGFLSQVIGTPDPRIQSQISELKKTFMEDVARYLYLCQSEGINNNVIWGYNGSPGVGVVGNSGATNRESLSHKSQVLLCRKIDVTFTDNQ